MLGKSIGKNSLILGLFALATAGTLALTNQGTQERIAQAERAAQQKALFEVLPPSTHDNDLLTDLMPVPEDAMSELGLEEPASIYIARTRGEISAIIVPAIAHDGYSGDISLIVGVNRDGSLAGVRVLKHKETPGLGDKIDAKKSPWILQFAGKSLNLPGLVRWKVKKDGGDFDQFAGATITPRAMVKQIRKVLEVVDSHHQMLFATSNSTATPISEDAHE